MSNAAVLSLMNMTAEQQKREIDLAMEALYSADTHALVMTIVSLVGRDIIEMTANDVDFSTKQAAVLRVAAAMVLQEQAKWRMQ